MISFYQNPNYYTTGLNLRQNFSLTFPCFTPPFWYNYPRRYWFVALITREKPMRFIALRDEGILHSAREQALSL